MMDPNKQNGTSKSYNFTDSLGDVNNHSIEKEFNLDDSFHDDDISSFVRAQNNRKYLRTGGDDHSTTSSMLNGGSISSSFQLKRPQSPELYLDDKEAISCNQSRICVRGFVSVILFMYTLLMAIWATAVKNNSKSSSGSLSTLSGDNEFYYSDLADTCSFMLIKNERDKKCREICEPISCCWNVNDENFGQCSEFEPNFCAQFLPCQSLLLFSGEITSANSKSDKKELAPPPEHILTLCAKNDQGAFVNEKLCFSVCIRGKCCFDPSKKNRCSNKFESTCAKYEEPCSEVLYGVFLPNSHNPYSN